MVDQLHINHVGKKKYLYVPFVPSPAMQHLVTKNLDNVSQLLNAAATKH
jgi:hypothetical protein